MKIICIIKRYKEFLVLELQDKLNVMGGEEGKRKEIWQSSSNTETKLFTHKMYAELVQNRYIQKNTDKVDDKSLYGTWL